MQQLMITCSIHAHSRSFTDFFFVCTKLSAKSSVNSKFVVVHYLSQGVLGVFLSMSMNAAGHEKLCILSSQVKITFIGNSNFHWKQK